jgi:hypothetical protein
MIPTVMVPTVMVPTVVIAMVATAVITTVIADMITTIILGGDRTLDLGCHAALQLGVFLGERRGAAEHRSNEQKDHWAFHLDLLGGSHPIRAAPVSIRRPERTLNVFVQVRSGCSG